METTQQIFCKSSRPDLSKIHGKTPVLESLFNKFCQKETAVQVFSHEFCKKFFKIIHFTSASVSKQISLQVSTDWNARLEWVKTKKGSTHQTHDIVSTSATSYKRIIDVETTSCVYWEIQFETE